MKIWDAEIGIRETMQMSRSKVSLRSCEYSKINELFYNNIHYITMILYLHYMNKKQFFSIKQDQRYYDPKA